MEANRIARVFPTITKMRPTDRDCYFGSPDMLTPRYDEIHISCCFTWDLGKANKLIDEWRPYGNVKVGGPAITKNPGLFVPGKYLRPGVTITSRGCPNKCPWCLVPKREGKIKELPVEPGNIIQDNNLLACSDSHISKVFDMLRGQRQIDFSGGLESCRITDKIVEGLRSLKIYQLWLAYDHPNQKRSVKKAILKLRKVFKRDKVRCYVLIGTADDTLELAEARLRDVYEMGALPFAMRYRTPSLNWRNTYLFKDRAWNLFTREWTRPAIIKSRMKARPGPPQGLFCLFFAFFILSLLLY